METYIRTFTGRKFYPLSPDPREVCIEDIAHALSLKCRWGGQCRKFYSVAAHSIHVSEMLPPEYQLMGLIHDAAEAYLCDLPRPIKYQFPEFLEAEDRLMQTILRGLVNRLPLRTPDIIKDADNAALYLESRYLFEYARDIPEFVPPVEAKWNFLLWSTARPEFVEQEFINRFFAALRK